jgi:hypothetical protein
MSFHEPIEPDTWRPFLFRCPFLPARVGSAREQCSAHYGGHFPLDKCVCSMGRQGFDQILLYTFFGGQKKITFQSVANTCFPNEYKYKYYLSDFFLRIRIQIVFGRFFLANTNTNSIRPIFSDEYEYKYE